jgi:GTP-binding protein Era
MNQLVGEKIAITSPVAQTTRHRLQGILTTDSAQMVFVDTPGIHKPHHQLGRILVQNAKMAIQAVDVVLFLVDGSCAAGGGDRFIADWLQNPQVPVILGANKLDQRHQSQQIPEILPPGSSPSHPIDASYTSLPNADNWTLVKFSALTGLGMDALQSLLRDRLREGPYYYPPDLVTDRPERFIMGELIREQILLVTREEVPHSVAVAVQHVEATPEITHVYADIIVERRSQKGILIGKGGQMLKKIGSAAREAMQKLIAGQVYLELFVKVRPKWRQSSHRLSELGYTVEET